MIKTKFINSLWLCLLCLLVTSCDPKPRFEALKLRLDGHEILSVQPNNHCVFYIVKDNYICCLNTQTNRTQKIVYFKKDYEPLHVKIMFEADQRALVTKLTSAESRSRRVSPSEGFTFETLGNWGIIATPPEPQSIEENPFEVYPHVFLLSQPGKCYELENAYQPTTINQKGKTIGDDCVKFTGRGNLIYYGVEWEEQQWLLPDSMLNFNPEDVSPILVQYCRNNKLRLRDKGLHNLLIYNVQLSLTSDGIIAPDCGNFNFENLHKTYSLKEMLQGAMCPSICDTLAKMITEDINEQAITFSQMIKECEYNPDQAMLKYPKGEDLYLRATLETVSQWGADEYKLIFKSIYYANCDNYLIAYSKDKSFVSLERPCEVVIKGKLLKREKKEYIFFSDENNYYFDDAELLLY